MRDFLHQLLTEAKACSSLHSREHLHRMESSTLMWAVHRAKLEIACHLGTGLKGKTVRHSLKCSQWGKKRSPSSKPQLCTTLPELGDQLGFPQVACLDQHTARIPASTSCQAWLAPSPLPQPQPRQSSPSPTHHSSKPKAASAPSSPDPPQPTHRGFPKQPSQQRPCAAPHPTLLHFSQSLWSPPKLNMQ